MHAWLKFNFSFPTQRWRITGNGHIASDTYKALTLQFKPTPSATEIGEGDQAKPFVPVPFVSVDIMNGGIDLKGYTEALRKDLSFVYKKAGGTLVEDRLGTKIESNEALIAYHIVFPNAVLWQIRKIKQFKNKIYMVTGQIVEAVPYLYLVLSDLPKIMNSVVICARA